MSPRTRLIAGTAGLVFAYFTVPVDNRGNTVLRVLLTFGALALVTVLIVQQVRHQMRRAGSPLWTLALALVAGVLAFALADYLVATVRPGEFIDLNTRLDALYFALTTLATVGYGDVHAEGQIARTVVSIQLAFNILVLTTAASVFVGELRSRSRRASDS
ncbi:potassium channel family protein [Catelliglobosispora koreensis]|uniref:potassium channel family protein n=1 Tax=Catelliglobosispora koreensis TaxID=129052 RepID=UPI00035FB245|nr:potassium channel family protein [Catelliglobosispora koreensis]